MYDTQKKFPNQKCAIWSTYGKVNFTPKYLIDGLTLFQSYLGLTWIKKLHSKNIYDV